MQEQAVDKYTQVKTHTHMVVTTHAQPALLQNALESRTATAMSPSTASVALGPVGSTSAPSGVEHALASRNG